MRLVTVLSQGRTRLEPRARVLTLTSTVHLTASPSLTGDSMCVSHGNLPLDKQHCIYRDNGSLIAGAIRATMLVARAAELADITCGIWAFTDQPEPIMVRPLSRGVAPQMYARIAGMDGWGDGTWLSDVFRRAVDALDRRSEPLKLLIVLHDGALIDADAERVQQIVATLPKRRIILQLLLLGDDHRSLEANTRVFGHVLPCPNIGDLAHRLSAWLRAIVGS